ncbi:MAG TPA: PilZ domain-containing protein [Nitrospirota bacterium]|nr:PilZ domain-containing protein [Nitrospirota bacterium]
MKKILIADVLKACCIENNSILDRKSISILTASTNDEILRIHKEQKADLIVSKIDFPGLNSEELYKVIRTHKDMREVAIIMTCEDTVLNRARCIQCSANVVLPFPPDTAQLHLKIQQLLDIAQRQAYRVTLKVSAESKFKNKPFLYRTDNISSTGVLITAEVREEEMLVKGDILSLSFYLPDGTRISASGTVERVIPQTIAPNVCLYGVKFTDLAQSVKSAISAFVNKELSYKRSLGNY